MCGIIGYIGAKKNVALGIEALKRLEYRGYDSAGLAVFDGASGEIFELKTAGRIKNLEEKFQKTAVSGCPFILHTRWATHGVPNEINAHPHHDCKKNIYLVHNGIIENFKSLRRQLEKEGHKFYSETDTEILCHLSEKFFKGNLENAVQEALRKVEGTYALAVISKEDPGKLVIARKSSPLLVGRGKKEFIVASDPAAIVSHTKKVVYLEDGDIAVITSRSLRFLKMKRPDVVLDWDWEEASKGGFPHYTLKEIYEAPEVIENAIRGRLTRLEKFGKLGGLERVEESLKVAKRLLISSSGSSYFSSLVGKYLIEEYAGLPVEVEHSAELRHRKPVLDENTAFLTVSQSGETADALAALREAKVATKKKYGKHIVTVGMVNVVGSSIARESENDSRGGGLYNYAGPEIGVASTKVFVSQLVIFALLALFLGRQRGLSPAKVRQVARELRLLSKKAKEVLALDGAIKAVAEKYCGASNFLYIGRKYNFPIALEGALKLKEISYVHAEGYGAGEMKHGPIALIDENFPTVALAPSDAVYKKVISNIMEIKARNGKIIAVATKGNREIKKIADDVVYIPKTLEELTPILSVIPLQLFAYHVAVLRGCDVDKPRNLAKSVTVE